MRPENRPATYIYGIKMFSTSLATLQQQIALLLALQVGLYGDEVDGVPLPLHLASVDDASEMHVEAPCTEEALLKLTSKLRN